MRARARRRPSCAAPLSRRSRVARRGLLSVRRLSTAADWALRGRTDFSSRSSFSLVKIRGKNGKSAAIRGIDPRSNERWRSRREKCRVGIFDRVRPLAIDQCDVSDLPSFIFRASRGSRRARSIAAFLVTFMCARARRRSAASSIAATDEFNLGLHRRNGTAIGGPTSLADRQRRVSGAGANPVWRRSLLRTRARDSRRRGRGECSSCFNSKIKPRMRITLRITRAQFRENRAGLPIVFSSESRDNFAGETPTYERKRSENYFIL